MAAKEIAKEIKTVIDSKEMSIVKALVLMHWPQYKLWGVGADAVSVGIKYVLDAQKMTLTDKLQKDLESCIRDSLKLFAQTSKNNSLTNREDREAIENMATGVSFGASRQTIEETVGKVAELLSAECQKRLHAEFVSCFYACLYAYPALYSALLSNNLDMLGSSVKNIRAFIENEFLTKLHVLYPADGMMRKLYHLFVFYFRFNPSADAESKILAKMQDEYNIEYMNYAATSNASKCEGLASVLAEYENTSESLKTTPLMNLYIHFIRADCAYFQHNYDNALEGYKVIRAMLKKGTEIQLFPLETEELATYIENSIAWSHHLRSGEGDNREAVSLYREMFKEEKSANVDQMFFSWRYRRNYGVCLEGEVKFDQKNDVYIPLLKQAVEQYAKSLQNLPKNTAEYKIYITYCAAQMKLWDRITGKTDGEWVKNIREMYGKTDGFCQKMMEKVEVYLEVAERKNNLFPDIYVQRAKLRTYQALLTKDKAFREECINKARKAILLVGAIDEGNRGVRYIKRDFYYAQYKLLGPEDGTEYYQKSWDENERLGNGMEPKAFAEMLKRDAPKNLP